MFFSLYTGEAPPICSYYKFLADGITEQGRVLVLQWNKCPTQLIQKPNKKTNLILQCQIRLILFNTNFSTKNYISLEKAILKAF